MAESSPSEEENNSWWTWFQSAKEKSSVALEFMKKDLTEFTQTVQHDAASAVSSTAALLKEKLKVDSSESVASKAKNGLTTLLDTITEVFAPSKEENEDELYIIHNSEPVILDRFQAKLHAIRTDPHTYSREPEVPPEEYESWLETFNLDSHQEEVMNIVLNCNEVRGHYSRLVPVAVSHLEFWQRYFYQVHQLEEAEAKRAEVMMRVDQLVPGTEDIIWDDDEVNPGCASQNSRDEIAHLGRSPFTVKGDSTGTSGVKRYSIPTTLEESATTQRINLPQIGPTEAMDTKNHLENVESSTTYPVVVKYLVEDEPQQCPCTAVPTTELVASAVHARNHDGNNNTPADKEPSSKVEPGSSCSVNQTKDSDFTVATVTDLPTKDKGDMVVVGSSTTVLSSDSSDTAGKDGSNEDDWEKDFDLEVSEEDLKYAEAEARKIAGSSLQGDAEWENWE